jgi:hypothetical protein
MIKFYCIALLLVCTFTFEARKRSHLQENHKISAECCSAQKAIMCGITSLTADCCVNCKSSWWYNKCLSPVIETCPNSCSNVCINKQGIVCGYSVFGGLIDCCSF